MLDRRQIKLAEQMDRPLSATQGPFEEAVILCEVIEAGVSKVFVKAVPDATEKIAGVAVLPYSNPGSIVRGESFTVPASGTLIFSLKNNNVVTLSELALVAGGSPLTIDETAFSGTPPTGTVKVDIAGGRIKFAVGDAGKAVSFFYRATLTLQQSLQTFQERNSNNRNLVGAFAQCSVGKGYVEFGTDQFDSSVDYSNPAAVLKLGPNGVITIGGAGAVLPQAKVLAVPGLTGSAGGTFLRVSMLIG